MILGLFDLGATAGSVLNSMLKLEIGCACLFQNLATLHLRLTVSYTCLFVEGRQQVVTLLGIQPCDTAGMSAV